MNDASSKILVAVVEQTVFIKIMGRADFTLSLDLKKLVKELVEKGYVHFIFELYDCVTMDSTFLGVLSGIGLQFSGGKSVANGASLELINPNPRIAETLENLGVMDLFTIRSCPDLQGTQFETVARSTGNSKLDITRNCLEAHKTLMLLRPENIQKFKDVAQFLTDDVKRLEAAAKK